MIDIILPLATHKTTFSTLIHTIFKMLSQIIVAIGRTIVIRIVQEENILGTE